MERPSYKLADRSAKLLQAIQQEDLETFTATLSGATPDEVRPFFFLFHNNFIFKRRLTKNEASQR